MIESLPRWHALPTAAPLWPLEANRWRHGSGFATKSAQAYNARRCIALHDEPSGGVGCKGVGVKWVGISGCDGGGRAAGARRGGRFQSGRIHSSVVSLVVRSTTPTEREREGERGERLLPRAQSHVNAPQWRPVAVGESAGGLTGLPSQCARRLGRVNHHEAMAAAATAR